MLQSHGYQLYPLRQRLPVLSRRQVQDSHRSLGRFYSSQLRISFPNFSPNRGQASGTFWTGPDWAEFQTRIAGNLKRVGTWKASNNNEYITVSCNDKKKNICNQQHGPGQAVGGYGWTNVTWYGTYHYVTFCKPFFDLESLNDVFDTVQKDLARGDTRWATTMNWLQTTGQFFLPEMMHTKIANGDNEPHITDELVGTGRAYGPKKVHALAKENIYNDGGARKGSTNADSYAMLANSLWWWDTTGYFPAPAAKESDAPSNPFPIYLHLDLDNKTDPATIDWNALYTAELKSYGDYNSDADVPSSSAPASPAATAPVPSPPPATDTCNESYKFLFDHFEIYGKDFDAAKFGKDGSGLKQQMKGCGDLTSFSFEYLTKDPNGYQWHVKGNMSTGAKDCAGRAVVSAGGASADKCSGSGL